MTVTDLIRKKLKKVSMENILSSNKKNEIFEWLEQKKNKKLKYKDVHEILKIYNEDYTKRQMTYYIQKGLIPEPKKTAPNQAEYTTDHIICFLIIDNMKEYIDREEIKKHLDLIITSKDKLDLNELLKVYFDLKHVNQLVSYVFNEDNISENKINNLDNIIVDTVTPEEEESLSKAIMSLFYFTAAKYFTDLFLKEIQ